MLDFNNIKTIDKSDMYTVLKNTYCQIEKSIKKYNSFNLNKENIEYDNIIINGMGGSAIGGDFVATVLKDELKIPLLVNRTYSLPQWVNKNTLVILCSYSGNTEETISCYADCKSKGVNPLIISSGGYLLDEARKHSYNHIILDKGIQPRAAFGFSSSLLLLSLVYLNIIDDKYIKILEKTTLSLKEMSTVLSVSDKSNKALFLAELLYDKKVIIYGTPTTEVVANRFRCQLSENAKILSQHYVVPEQNHNEIEGYINQNNANSIIMWIFDDSDRKEVRKRLEITGELLNFVKQEKIFEIGEHLVERLYKKIYLCDWISFYLSIMYNTDPTPVNIISQLKEKMSE